MSHATPIGYSVITRHFSPSTHDRSIHGLSPPSPSWPAPDQVVGLGSPPPRHKIAFFDIETTGLRNTDLIVCFALGFWTSPDADAMFHVKHYLCLDPTAERDMLQELLDELRPFHMICTYNGKSFDLPRTSGRCELLQLDPTPLTRLHHVDLVLTARRLLQSPSQKLSLGTLERLLLRFTRHDDLPGSEVPRRWHQFLQAQDPSLLDDIREHNLIDVVSLAALLDYFAQGTALPLPPGARPRQQNLLFSNRDEERMAPPKSAQNTPAQNTPAPPPQLGAVSPLKRKLLAQPPESNQNKESHEPPHDPIAAHAQSLLHTLHHAQQPITQLASIIFELAAIAPHHPQAITWLADLYDATQQHQLANHVRSRRQTHP